MVQRLVTFLLPAHTPSLKHVDSLQLELARRQLSPGESQMEVHWICLDSTAAFKFFSTPLLDYTLLYPKQTVSPLLALIFRYKDPPRLD